MMLRNWEDIWLSSEEILHKRLKANQFYPFTIRQPNVYELNYLNKSLCIGIILITSSFFFFIICLLFSVPGISHLAGFFVFVFLVGVWLILTNIGRRSIIIDLIENKYEFYIYRYLMHKGPLEEIYIRLKSQKTSQGVLYYKLILNGPHIEVLNLTGIKLSRNQENWNPRPMKASMRPAFFTTLSTCVAIFREPDTYVKGSQPSRFCHNLFPLLPSSRRYRKPEENSSLEKLGLRLAAKLNLNYFDCCDVSSRHFIRHWPH